MSDELISTAALSASDVPSPKGPLADFGDRDELPEIWRFAITYVPSRTMSFELVGFIATAVMNEWKKSDELPDVGLGTWRLSLLWMFHHWRHTQDDRATPWSREDSDEVRFTRFLVAEIHRELFQEESWWWEREHTPSDEERWSRALLRAPEAHDVAQLYEMAGEILLEAIQARDGGAADPMNIPLIETDPLWAARRYQAYELARGLVDIVGRGPAGLDEARDRAYLAAGSLTG